MFTEIRAELEQIAYIANTLITEGTSLTNEQTRHIQTIETNALHLIALTPQLEEKIMTISRKLAIRQMSTEWRTPLTSILGYTYLLSESYSSILSDNQISQLQVIRASAQTLMNWSNADEVI